MNSASNLPSRRVRMNALLSVLQPSPEARTIHRRLGHVLECQRFELLQAKADVWEPGETPEPRPVSAPKPPPIRKPSGEAAHDKLLPLIGAVPTTIRDLRAATGLGQNATYNGLHHLLNSGRIRNLARAVAQSYLDSRARLGFPLAPRGWADEVIAQLDKKKAA